MVTGRLPFDGQTFEVLAAKHIGGAHEPLATLVPDAPAALCAVIERCLTKDRADRWRTGRELADALMAVTVRRRWYSTKKVAAAAIVRGRLVAELALFGAALKAVFKWTAI
jgi:hypothetical protein